MPERGIVVLGFPRSGTTLLRRLLDAHPRIACPPETGVLAAAARYLREERVAGGVDVGVLSGLAQVGVTRDEARARVRALSVGFLEEHAARSGKARWAEKHPYDVFHLESIEALLGETVQYLALVRHPLDTVCSVGELVDRTGRYLDGLHRYVREDPRPRHAVMRAWTETTAALLDLARRRPHQVRMLRYEALAAQPQRVLDEVLAFLGEPGADTLLADALGAGEGGLGDWKTWGRSTVDASSVGRWRGQIQPDVVSELAEIGGPVVEAAGYDPLPVKSPPSPDAALRRLQLGQMLGKLDG